MEILFNAPEVVSHHFFDSIVFDNVFLWSKVLVEALFLLITYISRNFREVIDVQETEFNAHDSLKIMQNRSLYLQEFHLFSVSKNMFYDCTEWQPWCSFFVFHLFDKFRIMYKGTNVRFCKPGKHSPSVSNALVNYFKHNFIWSGVKIIFCQLTVGSFTIFGITAPRVSQMSVSESPMQRYQGHFVNLFCCAHDDFSC